jgi:hypothetical protein
VTQGAANHSLSFASTRWATTRTIGRDEPPLATLQDMWYVGGIAISLVLIVVLVAAAAKVMRKR